MAEAGLFANERVELLDGTIVTMSAQSSPHAATVTRLNRLLMRGLDTSMDVRPQLPVILDDWSEPEPDLIVCRTDPRDYAQGHPQPEDILLVCEVSISSLAYDREKKAAAYARAGIPEYWIVDVESRVVIVFDEPDPRSRRYRRERRVAEGGAVTMPGGTTLAVADILPPL
jgi:Uma2 family endonuclease